MSHLTVTPSELFPGYLFSEPDYSYLFLYASVFSCLDFLFNCSFYTRVIGIWEWQFFFFLQAAYDT